MTARDLFTVLIKMMGVFFLKDTILAFTSFFPLLTDLFTPGAEVALISIIVILLVVGLYGIVIYFLLFKTGKIIDTLKLTDGFDEAPFSFNIHRSTVLSISFIVTGILTIINAVPFLIKEIVEFVQYRRQGAAIMNFSAPYSSSYLVIYTVEIIVALLLIIYQKDLVNFIESKRKK